MRGAHSETEMHTSRTNAASHVRMFELSTCESAAFSVLQRICNSQHPLSLPPWRIVPICAYFRCSLSLAPVSLCALFWPAAIVSVEIDCWFGFTSWLQNGECASREGGEG